MLIITILQRRVILVKFKVCQKEITYMDEYKFETSKGTLVSTVIKENQTIV